MPSFPKQYGVSNEFSRHQDSLGGFERKISKLEKSLDELRSLIRTLESQIKALESASGP